MATARYAPALVLLALGSLLAGAPSCSDTGSTTCDIGSPGCPCAAGTCQPGLVCSEDVCVFPGGASTGNGETGNADAADETSAGGPSIFSLEADATSIAPGQMVSFTAQVMHPEGLSEIVGGTLRDEQTDTSYGSFVQISEGSFGLVTSWSSIDEVETISFEGTGSRTFVAVFVDNQERIGTRSLELPFNCNPNGPPMGGYAVCGDGMCRPLGTNSDCEGCDQVCPPAGLTGACNGGVCQVSTFSDCFMTSTYADCDEACSALGLGACANTCGRGQAIVWYGTEAECLDIGGVSISECAPLDSSALPYARCCCA